MRFVPPRERTNNVSDLTRYNVEALRSQRLPEAGVSDLLRHNHSKPPSARAARRVNNAWVALSM